MPLFLPIAAVLTASATANAPSRCTGETTLEVNACLNEQLGEANVEMEQYAETALAIMERDAKDEFSDALEKDAPDAFRRAQKAWTDYREAECEALYDNWSGGTIRNAMTISCEIRITRQRTHTIWENWLTFMDSTPPVLPEPSIKL
ncbi:lysozyme inhibitor LprI family protein [Altericroceibacterium spongiae]|nr:lysozyme inhibitor LprI family protein [Altericroceibacterium spongiae]